MRIIKNAKHSTTKKRKWPKRLLITGIVLVALFAIADIAGALYMYNFGFVPGEKSFLNKKQSSLEISDQKWFQDESTKESWHMESAGGNLRLQAYYVPAAKKSEKTVVMAHGYMQNNLKMAGYIHMFHNMGYNVLAPNDRGHGESKGSYAGYGWPDRLDYIKWTNLLLDKEGQDQKIGLFGVSMGGATVMFMSGEKLPTQVKAIVEDCGYDSINNELNYQLTQLFGLPEWPLMPTLHEVVKIKAGYDYYQGDAAKQLAKNKLPIFFIHGDSDKFVPTKMVYNNYKATDAVKGMWIVKGAGHAKSFEKNPKEYQQKVTDFYDKFLN